METCYLKIKSYLQSLMETLLLENKSLFAMLALGGCSFKYVLNLSRKSRQNWGQFPFVRLWYITVYAQIEVPSKWTPAYNEGIFFFL